MIVLKIFQVYSNHQEYNLDDFYPENKDEEVIESQKDNQPQQSFFEKDNASKSQKVKISTTDRFISQK